MGKRVFNYYHSSCHLTWQKWLQSPGRDRFNPETVRSNSGIFGNLFTGNCKTNPLQDWVLHGWWKDWSVR